MTDVEDKKVLELLRKNNRNKKDGPELKISEVKQLLLISPKDRTRLQIKNLVDYF